jgi:transposase
MARFDLTDFEWSVIKPLLPNKSRGVPRVDDRRVLIPILVDHDPKAQLRVPMDMIFQGMSMSLFQA